MIAYLGPPPREMLERSDHANNFFDTSGNIPTHYSLGSVPLCVSNCWASGNWKGLAEIPSKSLEDLERNLQGEHQADFLRFIRRMLRWCPEERPSAEELLSDPWLRSP